MAAANDAPGAPPPSAVDDPDLLGEIEGLHLSARQIVHGALAGVHRSLRRGTSIEFSELMKIGIIGSGALKDQVISFDPTRKKLWIRTPAQEAALWAAAKQEK